MVSVMPIQIVASIIALFAQDLAAPAVTVETSQPGTYILTVTLEGTADPSQGRALLGPKASELCGDLGFTLGRYQFEATAPASGEAPDAASTKVTLRQDVSCGVAPPMPAAEPIAPITDADATRLQPIILALSETYFSALDDGRDAESLALTLPSMNGGATLAEWATQQAARRAAVGPLTSRTVAKLSWYSNPPDVDPGLYVAADFAAYAQLADECGYLVWFSPTGEPPFGLVRQEMTQLPHTLDPETVAALRRQYCILL